MEEGFENIVYSRNVIEFVTVAKEYCSFVEGVESLPKQEFLDNGRKILSLLYLKASMLPKLESIFEDATEKYVSESDWNYIHDNVKLKLAQHNDYLEVFDPNMHISEGPLSASLAENFADIYQDLKDFISNFGIGNEEIMNDAIWECRLNFEEYWGQRLVNALRAIHSVLYSGESLDENDNIQEETNKGDTARGNWLFEKKQDEFRSGTEE